MLFNGSVCCVVCVVEEDEIVCAVDQSLKKVQENFYRM